MSGRRRSLPTVITGQATPTARGWMPDGSALLLSGYAVVPLDGSAGYELKLGGLDPSLGGQATYSPDGTRVAVVTGNSITVLDAEGSLYRRWTGVWAAWRPGRRMESASRRYPTAS